MSRNLEKGLAQEEECLILIGRFGWLRIQEIGLFFWPDIDKDKFDNELENSIQAHFNCRMSVNRYQYAQNLVKKLISKNQVLTQKLPEHAGTAVVLTEKGAKIARKYFKYIRRARVTVNEEKTFTWTPPKSWKHDLLSHGLCSLILSHGKYGLENATFRTDHELRISDVEGNHLLMQHVRYPDLMIEINYKGERVMWGIEIEKSRKHGERRNIMIENAVINNKNDGYSRHSFDNSNLDKIVFAYDPHEIEHTCKGKLKRVNHRSNIEKAFLNKAININAEAMDLYLIELEVKNFGVVNFNLLFERIDTCMMDDWS